MSWTTNRLAIIAFATAGFPTAAGTPEAEEVAAEVTPAKAFLRRH
jgi:hypothetical protein